MSDGSEITKSKGVKPCIVKVVAAPGRLCVKSLAMARQVRIEFADAIYHVMGRGNQGRAIYADDRDRKRWFSAG